MSDSLTSLLRRVERLRLKILELDNQDHPVEIVAMWGDDQNSSSSEPGTIIIQSAWGTQALDIDKI